MVRSFRNMLLAAIPLLAILLETPPASAGDTAALNVLGFSADGGIFAFEEYGTQDGSGFPYANRFYIDTKTDRFLAGTPIRVRLDDEAAGLDQARRQAKTLGQKIVSDEVLAANQGFTAAFNAVTEVNADPARIVAYPLPVFPPVGEPIELRLEEIAMPDAERCYDLGELKGFRLLKTEQGDTVTLHADASVPKSRGCATGYRLAGLQVLGPYEIKAFAVLVAVRSLGFEGPDYRWLAVTGQP